MPGDRNGKRPIQVIFVRASALFLIGRMGLARWLTHTPEPTVGEQRMPTCLADARGKQGFAGPACFF